MLDFPDCLRYQDNVSKFCGLVLWIILLVLCWPMALLALMLYPLIWFVLLPLRLTGIAVDSVFELLRAILNLPGRLLRASWKG